MAETTQAATHVSPGCRAIVSTSGTQCGAGDDEICGTHKKSRSITRVDDFDQAPAEDLRDELVEECDMNGVRAYQLATLADDVSELWDVVSALEPVEVAGEEWSVDSIATHAKNVAKHPDLDVDDHPLAQGRCIAKVPGNNYGGRCNSGCYGTKLLCGTHYDVDDVETIYGTNVRDVEDALEAIEDDVDEDDQGDEPEDVGPRPDLVAGVGEDDSLLVELEGGRAFAGTVNDLGGNTWSTPEDAEDFSLYVSVDSEDVRDSLKLEARRPHGESWPQLTASDLAFGVDPEDAERELGTVATVSKATTTESDPDSGDEPQGMSTEDTDADDSEEWVDPIEHEHRVDELLEDTHLSEREAQVVAAKEQGVDHGTIAEFLEISRSTVDEYSRRASQKVEKARALLKEVGDVYPEEES